MKVQYAFSTPVLELSLRLSVFAYPVNFRLTYMLVLMLVSPAKARLNIFAKGETTKKYFLHSSTLH